MPQYSHGPPLPPSRGGSPGGFLESGPTRRAYSLSMRVFHCDEHPVPLPPEHRFPMGKYAQLRRALIEEGVLEGARIESAPLAEPADLVRVHAPDYVDAFTRGALDRDAVRRIGFPWSAELVRRSTASVGATLAATESALEHGAGGALAGGTHHAHRDFGAGFCVFNDIAVAARRELARGRVRRVLVFDVDVHQGDGTARIFDGDERVFTCSLHGARNFPGRKAASDLDVPLPDGTGDEPYLDALRDAWRVAVERARPDLVFYQGGVDPLREDRLGRLALTHAGLYERDRFAFTAARALGLPVVVTLGGGYAEPIELSVRAHVGTYRALTAG